MSMVFQQALVAVLKNTGFVPAGAGVLVNGDLVLTCAHVVNVALGRSMDEPEKPSSPVLLTFASNKSTTRSTAAVVSWVPPEFGARVSELSDIALLRVKQLAPGAAAARLRVNHRLPQAPFSVLGFPDGYPGGQSQTGTVGERDAWGQYELLPGSDPRLFVRPG